ncbi:MAG: tRNA 2-thiouridine(34) synthase MnmA [Candidatus Gracilibacteria bacterium]
MKKLGKVVVAMSGGVDSSMAAMLLKKQGYDVVGVTLKLVDGSRCCDIEAVGHAKEVCRKFGIPHYVFDVSKEFNKIVIGYFMSELVKNRTPNPCVICNRFLKFDQLFKIAKKLGVAKVATGHYAQICKSRDDAFELKKGLDRKKDQSYYLSFLKQSWLKKILFPIGRYDKAEVYKLAKKEGLDFLVSKKQSQDLCFVAKRLKGKSGEIVDTGGKVLGSHDGIHHYTIGQRKGLLVPGGPYFVVGFDCKKNRVIVSGDSNDPMLFQKVVKLKNVNFISGRPKRETRVMAKIRYQQPLASAILKISGRTVGRGAGRGAILEFKTPQRAVTKGQIAVFYVGEKCLGGGIIK